MSGVRFRALTFRKMGASSKSGASLPLYKQILSKMPKELKESLVCWYSPNLQGLTNAELYNSDNLYEGGLHDLSGNRHDMDLHGFDGVAGGGHVDEEGNLVFDGVNDWAYNLFGQQLYNASLFVDIADYKESSSNCVAFGLSSNTNTSYARVRLNGVWTSSNDCVLLGKSIGKGEKGVNVWVVKNGTSTSPKDLTLVKPRTGLSAFFNITYKSVVLFNQALTEEQIEWVKTNMLVSQEVKKHNVGLWVVDDESGEFYCIDTIKVQSGNSIGKYDEEGNVVYPTYDIDATHCTDYTWYTDIECTEEYYNDAITADVNLYCKKIRISDDMLHKLSLISLDDDSTLDEHLVVWYSPKLQGLTKKSVFEDATLEDLSGNGNDSTLVGFTADMDVLGDNNVLIFNGGRTSVVNIQPITNYTIFDSYKYLGEGSSIATSVGTGSNADAYGYILRPTSKTTLQLSVGNTRRTNITIDTTKFYNLVAVISSVNNSYVYIDNIVKAGTPYTYETKNFYYAFASKVEKGDFVLFDLELSSDIIEKVKSIMLRNTPQQQKHHITFMYGDSVVEEMDVLHESNIYNLPKTELNSYLRADKWFKDAELTEEFSNTEYVTEDMTLYCSTEFIYKDMLEQLNGVVLEDGTTAREHLVC